MQRLLAFFFAAALLWTPAWSQSAPDALVPDLSQYILTPPAPPTPRINGAKVFGARPGSEFLFAIPASGDRPMTFAAEGLPKGLSLDPSTGFITGRVKKPGTYLVKLTARNALGEATRELRIVIGERIALTPPMGGNSWNCWARDVAQEQVLSSARAMVESGLVNHGWTYINIDDGWQGRRGGRYNAIQTNDKFPDMKELSEQVHAMGLKLGIYSSPWIGTYAAHIGSYSDNPDGENQWIKDGNHNENFRYEKPGGNYWQDRKEMYRHGAYSFVEADARQWADWQIDYLKYDWNPNDLYHVKEMHDALRATDRDIVYSISNSAPYADAPLWVEYTDCWRTTGDIRDTWKSISSIGFEQQRWAPFCGPGHWPDADMLVVGLVGWGPKLHYTKLTADEQYTHMSLWAMLASPATLALTLLRSAGQAVPMASLLAWVDAGLRGGALYRPGTLDDAPVPAALRPLRRWALRHEMAAYMLMLALCWSPYLIAFYPGTVCWDLGEMVAQFFGQRPMDTWHPVFLTWVIGGCVWLGRLVGSDNLGAALYTLIQTELMAFALSGVLRLMRALRLNRAARLAARKAEQAADAADAS